MSTNRAGLLPREQLSEEVCLLTFGAAPGTFTGCEPGAHVSVHLGPDLVRSYSLTDWSADGAELTVAVKAERQGRGGSLAMHRLECGSTVELSGPRNNFRLDTPDGTPIVLLAGGIGITALCAMGEVLRQRGADYELVYVGRSREVMAYAAELGYTADSIRAFNLFPRTHHLEAVAILTPTFVE